MRLEEFSSEESKALDMVPWQLSLQLSTNKSDLFLYLRGDERSHTSECSLDSKSNEQLLYISRPPKSLPCLPQSATIYHII